MKTKANRIFFSLLGLIALTSANGIASAGDLSDQENAAINRQLEQAKANQAAIAALQAALAASQAALAASQAALATSQTALAASQAALAALKKPAATDKPPVAVEAAEVAAVAINTTTKPSAALPINRQIAATNKPAVAIEAAEGAAAAINTISKPAAAAINPTSKPAAAVAINTINKPAAAINKPAVAIEAAEGAAVAGISKQAAVAINTISKPSATLPTNRPIAATNKSTNARAVLSDEEDAATNRHQEQLKAQQTALAAANTAAAPHAVHAASCHAFTESERKTIDKGEVVLGTLEKNGHNRIRARVHISAPPHIVWETVHEERKTDPDLAYSKVLETSGHNSVLEQKFQLIPFVGTSVCVMKNSEVPGHRIDYSLVKSDRFKALEGTWIVSANPDGSTILELSSYIDMGLPVPRGMLEAVASKKLAGRLQNIRKMAEKSRPAHSVAAKAVSH